MATSNIHLVRQQRNKSTGSKAPLLDKDGAPLSYRTHNTGNLNAAFKAVRKAAAKAFWDMRRA